MGIWRSASIYFQKYSKGKTVYNKGDHCTSLDIVVSGSLIAYSLAENGSANTLFEFKSGNILGANLLFAKSDSYPLNIYCLSDCELVHIRKKAVARLLHHYDFVIQYIKSLSQNSQGLNQKIAMFFEKTLRENILDYLKMQSVIQKTNRITLPVTKKELADYLGVQRPSLFRELKKMKEAHLIHVENRVIILL